MQSAWKRTFCLPSSTFQNIGSASSTRPCAISMAARLLRLDSVLKGGGEREQGVVVQDPVDLKDDPR